MFWLTGPMYGLEKKKRMVSSKKTSTLANLGHLLFLYTFSLSVYCITFTSSFVRAGESPVEYTLTKSTGIHENTDTFAYDRNLFEKAMAAIKEKNSSSKSLYSSKFMSAKLGATRPEINNINSNGKGVGGLGVCEGDCDSDRECGVGLTCFQRDGNEAVPGCSGSGKSGWDYCVAIKPLDSSRNGGGGYGMCEGDCDKDSDCDAGLKCFQRNGYEAVPGCSGSGKSG